MSTSTVSNVLIQVFYAFSLFKHPDFKNISDLYNNEPRMYMISQRKPITSYLKILDKEKGIYALDSDKGIFV
jgi:hypothetical protein